MTIKINGEPPHNTESVFCWCAPRVEGDIVIHRSIEEISTEYLNEENKTPCGDIDALAISEAVDALKKSTSRHLLRANIDFVIDYFLVHPSGELPEHLKPAPDTAPQRARGTEGL